MASRLATVPFLNRAESRKLLDVRSPSEFSQGHIPGAISFPLFSDEQRVEVGTLYKQEGKEPAFLKGLDFTGPKMSDFVRRAREIAPDGRISMYCWRGGMRSGSMAWLLETAGMEVEVLEGGYKSFRQAVLNESPLPHRMRIIGGFTGSRKTEILRELRRGGESVLDLELLACHKGSAFGNIAQPEQPRQEQFENQIYMELLRHPADSILWLEDESKAIGRLRIPDLLHARMRESEVLFIEKSPENRLRHIVDSYGKENIEELKFNMQRIARRLGGQALKDAMQFLEEGNIAEAAGIALYYYDKTYRFGLEQRKPSEVTKLNGDGLSDAEAAVLLLRVAGAA
jgi:tRNA 2-selenouridine synthase